MNPQGKATPITVLAPRACRCQICNRIIRKGEPARFLGGFRYACPDHRFI